MCPRQREVDIVSVFRSRPAVRWLVPAAAAAVVIGGGAAAGTLVASADPSLPPRSAAQLLVDVQTAHVAGLSGTIVETADLGLPSLPGLNVGGGDVTKLITGSNTARVWYAVAGRQHTAVRCEPDLSVPHDPVDVVVGHEVVDHRRASAEHHVARGLELRVR